MNTLELILFAGLGTLVGGGCAWALGRIRVATLDAHCAILEDTNRDLLERLSDAQTDLTHAREEISRQRERLVHYEEKIGEQATTFRDLETKLTSTFKVLSSEALKSNAESFSAQFNATARALLEQVNGQSKAQTDSGHKLLDTLGQAISEKLGEVDRSVKEIEKLRISGDVELKKQIEQLANLNTFVGSEASKLSQALTNSRVQGVWGEMQLRNVVEAAGMSPYCDFFQQDSSNTVDGDGIRPDMRVRLPNNYNVLIDAKAPTKCFIEAVNAIDDKQRRAKMKELCSAIRGHIRTMSRKDYPRHFAPALEYTVVFLPSESLFVAAVEEDRDLLMFAEENKVLLTTPLSLVALLRAVACGWTNVKVHNNAQEIQKLGIELFERMNRFYDRFASLGKGIDAVVRGYNEAAASGRMLTPTRRKFAELGAGDTAAIVSPEEVMTDVRVVERTPEQLRALVEAASEGAIEDYSSSRR